MTLPRRIGVMGGTFDPIHHGHLVAAAQVQAQCALDEVVFVPTGRPWQKDHRVTDAEHRFVMTVLATVDQPHFSVSRVDIDRPGPTYAVDTLADLQLRYGPGAELFFITGADALATLPTWKDHERIFELATVVGVTRPGHRLAQLGEATDSLRLVEVTAMAISATQCRRRVAAGEPLDYLVPAGVAAYIEKNRLYR